MKILLIEDDTFFQRFYSQKLADSGYQVEVAGDGNEGLAKMNSFMPEAVLLDLIMPNKDGFEVLEEVSKNETLKKIPIIVFSTLGNDEDMKKAMELGAVDYINKSFHDIEKLKSKIVAHTAPLSLPQQASASVQPAVQPTLVPVQQPGLPQPTNPLVTNQPVPQLVTQPTQNGTTNRTT